MGVGTLRVGLQLHAGEIAAQGVIAHILRHLTKLQQVPTGTEEGILKSGFLFPFLNMKWC